jgi:murein DD-endopeptidase MepM/ murein hydrolase activator NlpD
MSSYSYFNVLEHLREQLPRIEDIYSISRDGTSYSDEEVMSHAFWINDLLFVCPPQMINTQSEQMIANYQSLRANSTSKVPVGKGTKFFSVKLKVPSKAAIVNVDFRLADENAITMQPDINGEYHNTGKRGGILDLIIQFKNTPFARLENGFIRSTLNIPKEKNIAICLHQINVSTTKDKFNCLDVDLLFSVFNYSPFSPNFYFKEDWATKEQYGSFTFEDVNIIDFGFNEINNLRRRYKIYIPEVPLESGGDTSGEDDSRQMSFDTLAAADNAISPFIREVNGPSNGGEGGFESSTVDQRNEAFREQYNLIFTEGEEELNLVDSKFMRPALAVADPSVSAVFKAYVDWLHSKWHQKEDSEGQFNAAAIQRYGSLEHNLGDAVILTWKEFKTEPMPRAVEQEIKAWYRRRLNQYQEALASRNLAQPITDFNSPISQINREIENQRAQEEAPPQGNWFYEEFDIDPRSGLAPPSDALTPSAIAATGLRFLSGASTEFGFRREDGYHRGVDLINTTGPRFFPVFAMYDGTLTVRETSTEPPLTAAKALEIFNAGRVPIGFQDARLLDGRVQLKRENTYYDVEYTVGGVTIYPFSELQVPDNATEGQIDAAISGGAWATLTVSSSEYAGTEVQGLHLRYFHLSYMSGTTYGSSRVVSKGEIIGYTGSTGIYTDSPHLHFEMWRNTASHNRDTTVLEGALDPTPFLFQGERSEVSAEDAVRQSSINSDPVFYTGLNFTNPSQTIQGRVVELAPAEQVGQGRTSIEEAEAFTEEILDSLPLYRDFVIRQNALGWQLYQRNVTAYNIFYRNRTISIPSGDTEAYPMDAPIVCNFIAGSANNLFAMIPMAAHAYPTAQYLGKRDDQFVMNFAAVGLNNIKMMTEIRDTLKAQALKYKFIPESWLIKIENNLINAFGSRYFAVSNMAESTIPGRVGTYNIELGVVTHPIDQDQDKISYVGTLRREEVKLSFLRELLGNGNYENAALKIVPARWDFDKLLIDGTVAAVPQPSSAYAVIANPDLLNGTTVEQGSIQEGPDAAGPQSNALILFNYLNQTIAPVINLINSLFSQNVHYNASEKFLPDYPTEAVESRASFLGDIDFGPVKFFFSNARNQECPVYSFHNARAIANNYPQEKFNFIGSIDDFQFSTTNSSDAIRAYFTAVGTDSLQLFRDSNGLRWSEREVLHDFNEIVSRISDIKFTGRDYATESEVDAILVQSRINDSDAGYLNDMRQLRVGIRAPFAAPYLDISPVARMFAHSANIIAAAQSRTRTNLTVGGRDPSGGRYSPEGYPVPYSNEAVLNIYNLAMCSDVVLSGVDLGWTGFAYEAEDLVEIPGVSLMYKNYRSKYDNDNDPAIYTRPRSGVIPDMGFAYPITNNGNQFKLTLTESGDEVNSDYIFSFPNEDSIVNKLLERKRAIDAAVPGLEFSANKVLEFENYLWEQLAIPYLNNAIRMEDIERFYLLEMNGVPLFPETRQLKDIDRVSSIGGCYADIELPLHPFWNSNQSVLPVGNIYTDPDFYMVNYGIDTNLEVAHIVDENGQADQGQGNRFVQIQAELASHSMDLTEGTARDPNGSPVGAVLDGKSQSILGMVNGFNNSMPNLFQKDAVYLISEHGIGSNYSSGNENEETLTSNGGGSISVGRAKGYSEAVNEGLFDLSGGLSPDRSIASIIERNGTGTEARIGSMISQSLIDSKVGIDERQRFHSPIERPDSGAVDSSNSDIEALEHNLNVGMNTALRESGQSEELVYWKDVVSLYGPNAAFPNTPMSFNGRSYNGMGFDGYARYGATRMIESLRGTENTDFIYDFSTEPTGSNPSEFVNGNWGYSDIHQFSNSRIATYEKIRDALKNVNKKKWAYKKAFPTFKVFLIEEDQIEREWIQYDDFYQYNQIQEISISDSRKRPSSVAMITFVNVGGALDGHNQWHYNTRPGANDEYIESNPNTARRGRRYNRVLYGDTTLQNAAGTNVEQNSNIFVLATGIKLKIKLGYSNNPSRMEDVFLGSVAEVIQNGDSATITIVAQGYGAELVEKPKGTTKEEIINTYYTTFDALASLMFSPEVKHFGKRQIDSVSMVGQDQSLQLNQLIYKNTVYNTLPAQIGRVFKTVGRIVAGTVSLGITELAGYLAGASGRAINEITRQLRQIRVSPMEGPQDDNIYVPNYTSQELNYYWFNPVNIFQGRWRSTPIRDSAPVAVGAPLPVPLPQGGFPITPGNGEINLGPAQVQGPSEDVNYAYFELISPSEIEYNVFYSSIWDVFEEMTYRHPGFVKHPRIYKNSNRMTMFFGLPDQKYWASEPNTNEVDSANRIFNEIRQGAVLVESRQAVSSVTQENQILTGGAVIGPRIGSDASRANIVGTSELAVNTKLVNDWLTLVSRRLKPFREWHNVNSATDIITNSLESNKNGFYTSVSLQYLSSGNVRKLKSALRALGRQSQDPDALEVITPSNFISWSDREVEHVQAHRDMSPEFIRQKFHQFANCKSRMMARRYARALLADYAREMYKGSLLILGNPRIKPYDVVILNDYHSKTVGPLEVEEVIHTFTPATGFVTEIIPDTFIIEEDRTAFVIYNSIFSQVQIKADHAMEQILFTRDQSLPPTNEFNILAETYTRSLERERAALESFQELISDLSPGNADYDSATQTISTLSSIGAIAYGAGVASAGPAILGIAATGVLAGGLMSRMLNYFFVNYVHNNRAYFMIPLIKNNTPWVTGYDMTATNSFYISALDVLRNWWADGGEGLTLSNTDQAISEQRMVQTLSSDLNTFSQIDLNWNDLGRSIRSTFGGAINSGSGVP